MATSKRRLKPVPTPPPDPEHQALLEDVRAFAEGLPAAYLECRDLMHNWLPFDIGRHRDGGYERTLRCSRCKCRKTQHLSVDGMLIGGGRMQYPDGYLSEDGLGRLDGAARGAMRSVSVQRTFANTSGSRTRKRKGA